MNLRFGYTWPDTIALGPGHRYVIWTQGCSRRCYRCTSPELQSLDGGKEKDISLLAEEICDTEHIDGITISGGEPLLQHEALREMLMLIARKRPELNVILFTGYQIEEIVMSERKTILDRIDLLIDGEYIDEQNTDGIGLRGSANQRFHFLTDRLQPYEKEITYGSRKREMHLLGEYEMLTIGIPPRRSQPATNNLKTD